MEVSMDNSKSARTKLKAWKAIIIYSSIVMLLNITTIFLQIPALDNFSWNQKLKNIFPEWMKDTSNQEHVIGLIGQEASEKYLYIAYLPYLTYFILALYCSYQAERWAKQDELVSQTI